MSQTTNILDKTSEYYRICPFCKTEFMAEHMSREYCNDDCGDDFNNRKKRLNKNKLKIGVNEKEFHAKSTLNSERNFEDMINQNISILYQLSIDPKFGSIISYDFLDSIGFNVNYFNKIIPVKPNLNKFKIEIGPFSISRIKYNLAHIETIKTNKK